MSQLRVPMQCLYISRADAANGFSARSPRSRWRALAFPGPFTLVPATLLWC